MEAESGALFFSVLTELVVLMTNLGSDRVQLSLASLVLGCYSGLQHGKSSGKWVIISIAAT